MTNNCGMVVPGMLPPRSIKSEKCAKVCFVRFMNQSKRFVEVVWINYKGIEERYKVLAPKEAYDVKTFETHPWIFRDHFTYQALYVNSSEVYYPQPRSVPMMQGQLLTARPIRVMVQINIAVYALKDMCLCSIRSALRSKDDVSELEIPRTLKEDLSMQWRNG